MNNLFNSPGPSIQWEAANIDIMEDYQKKGGHVDVTNVVRTWNDNPPLGEGYICKFKHYASIETALVVVAWSEKPTGENWQVCFRVIYWEDTNEDLVYEQYEGEINVISDPDFNYTYPAVSANVQIEYVYDDPEPILLVVYLAYEKWEPEEFGRDVCYSRYSTDFGDLEHSNFDQMGAELTLNTILPLPPITCRHPDIIFYNYLGQDGFNSGCETVFVACDYVADIGGGFYQSGIAAWEPANGIFDVTNQLSNAPPFPGYAGHFVKPEFPRIDAGIDYYLSPSENEPFPLSIFAVTWHEHKWDALYLGEELVTIYEDYDWFYSNYDLSQFPVIWFAPIPVYMNNNPAVWDMYPYIDIDPVETKDQKAGWTYSHFVWTRGQDIWPDNDAFMVRYTNSNMLRLGEWEDVVEYHQSFSGQASILMYAKQYYEELHYRPPLPHMPDFDVFFISNHEPDGVYRYYSKKFCFDDLYDLLIDEFDEAPVPISPLGYAPPPGEILYDSLAVKSPIGALFDHRSECVVWKEWDSSPSGLHHIYGNYEISLLEVNE